MQTPPAPLAHLFQCHHCAIASTRESELLEASYQYVLEHGFGDLALRPLATAIGSSAGVLIYLFQSKDGLVRALLARARIDELATLDRLEGPGLQATAGLVWLWLADPAHRPVLRLWVEAYGLSLVHPEGPWADFARSTVEDWLTLLAKAQPSATRRSKAGETQRTLALAVLRGALLDLLATDDVERTSAAVRRALAEL